MNIINKEFILYGLSEHRQIIDNIITELNVIEYLFEIKLILTEALTNAFKHGNKSDTNKPIYLRCSCDGLAVNFEVEDSGEGFVVSNSKHEQSDENILDDSGRGLFLINCMADRVELRKNTLFIQKNLVA